MTLQCRTCASVIYNKNAVNIFKFDNLEVLTNIQFVVGTKLINDSELPSHTCGCCLLDLKRAVFHINVFRERYNKAQKELQGTSWKANDKLHEIENNDDIFQASDNLDDNPNSESEDLMGFEDEGVPTNVSDDNDDVGNLIFTNQSEKLKAERRNSVEEFKNISLKDLSSSDKDLDSNPIICSYLNEAEEWHKEKTEKASSAENDQELRKIKVKTKRYSSWKNLTEDQVIERKRQQRRRDCICDQCGRHFTDQSNFKLHMIRHSGIKNFECKECAKRFYTEHLLQLHERIVHQGERPYACRYCERRFQNSTSRIVHERGHNNVRPYSCKFCEKTFTYSTGLSRHLLIHNGVRPYFCTVCDRNFQRNTHLKAHLRSKQHTLKQANANLLRESE